jgi:hypothetical protein
MMEAAACRHYQPVDATQEPTPICSCNTTTSQVAKLHPEASQAVAQVASAALAKSPVDNKWEEKLHQEESHQGLSVPHTPGPQVADHRAQWDVPHVEDKEAQVSHNQDPQEVMVAL